MLSFLTIASIIFFRIAIIILIYTHVQWLPNGLLWIPGLLYGIICLILSITCSFAQTVLVLLTEKDKEDKK